MTNLLNNGDTYLRSDEVLTDPLAAIGFFTGPGNEVMNTVTAAAQSAEDVELLTTSYSNLVQSGQDYLEALNAPGIPDVYFIAIVLVGLVVAGLIAVHSPRVPTKFSTLMLLTAVFIVGLLQLPLWVLNSRFFERRLLDTLRFDQSTNATATGQTIVIILVALLLIAVVAVLTWRARRQREAISDE